MTASREALGLCLQQCGPEDSILFLDAGVNHIFEQSGEGAATAPCAINYLAADLQARGLLNAARARKASLTDDARFVQLLHRHSHCLSWK
jgi:sulfur relay protein TusB/DsrH